MVHATVRMVIPANERGEVLEILRSIAERTRLEQGCIGCDVYQAAEEDLAILVEELWKSEEDLERHLRSEEYRKLLLVVEMALEPPEIRFDAISHSTGFETIEKARNVIP
jgi:quinol monooxygenase YgiN